MSGEVFCVSTSLFPSKIAGAKRALANWQADLQFVLFNDEVLGGWLYQAKTANIAFFSHDTATHQVKRQRRDSNSATSALDLSGPVEWITG